MKVKLKEGIGILANSFFELRPGIVSEIPDKMFDSESMIQVSGKIEQVVEKKEEKVVVEVKENKINNENNIDAFKKELIDLPGIGPKIAADILKMATTKNGLGKIPRQTLIDELRDDVVIVLDNYLGR